MAEDLAISKNAQNKKKSGLKKPLFFLFVILFFLDAVCFVRQEFFKVSAS